MAVTVFFKDGNLKRRQEKASRDGDFLARYELSRQPHGPAEDVATSAEVAGLAQMGARGSDMPGVRKTYTA